MLFLPKHFKKPPKTKRCDKYLYCLSSSDGSKPNWQVTGPGSLLVNITITALTPNYLNLLRIKLQMPPLRKSDVVRPENRLENKKFRGFTSPTKCFRIPNYSGSSSFLTDNCDTRSYGCYHGRSPSNAPLSMPISNAD
jgi:hypothetical protein